MTSLVAQSNGHVSVSVPVGVSVITTIVSSWCPSVPVVLALTVIPFVDTLTPSKLQTTRAQNTFCSMNSERDGRSGTRLVQTQSATGGPYQEVYAAGRIARGRQII
jgi:hypothetical protein